MFLCDGGVDAGAASAAYTGDWYDELLPVA